MTEFKETDLCSESGSFGQDLLDIVSKQRFEKRACNSDNCECITLAKTNDLKDSWKALG